MPRVLIVAATTGYQTRVFEQAARDLGLDVMLATDRCVQLEDPWGDDAVAVRFQNPEQALPLLIDPDHRPDGVVALGDNPTLIAALTAATLGLPYHSAEAVQACRNKHETRERLRRAGLPVPDYVRVPVSIEPCEAERLTRYPCVLKPLGLSGSRGVIRVNDSIEFAEAFERIRALLQAPDIRRMGEDHSFIQVERFIPGREFALEGLVTNGELRVLALFDKPDPLDGPFFEETIYVTPSREPGSVQQEIIETTRRAVTALGLSHGPVHAEMRSNSQGVWMLEVAARPIGGLCSRSLHFKGRRSLEEVIICHALGEDVSSVERESGASGVMMIPIPENGIYLDVVGTEQAASVPGIDDIVITAKPGQRMLKLPEGASYLGFIFARADTPESVESALRNAHSELRFKIAKELEVFRPQQVSS